MLRKIVNYSILVYGAIALLALIFINNPLPTETKYDCIIILGNSPNTGNKPNPFLKMRLNSGILFFHQGYSNKLILTGTKKESLLSEAAIMQEYCINQGISLASILLDESAKSTRENLINTSQIMNQSSFRNALVVTSNHHVWRTKKYCKRLKLNEFEVVGSKNTLVTVALQPILMMTEVVKSLFMIG